MRLLRDQAGASAIEFALVVPILIALLIGICDFGRYAFTNASLHHASRQAVRMAIVRSSVSGNEADVATVKTYALGRAIGINTAACASPAVQYSAGNVPGSVITVAMTCPFRTLIPGLSFTLQVTQRSSMTIST